ncbi:MAG: alpha/beta fold hydrolase [Simkania negevensis]|nr:alpha/beta fold hydrolase [Simkania negevensis]
MKSIVFLPGFLGAKEDWKEVLDNFEDFKTLALDLPCQDVLETLSQSIQQFCSQPVILIGYSMGGRMALQLQKKAEERYEKVIVLGAHLGIQSEEERKEILKRDETWAHQLETLPFEEFLEKWYNNALFTPLKSRKEAFEKMLHRRRKGASLQWASLLRNWSVGHFLPCAYFPSNTSFLYRELDKKYETLYRHLPAHVVVKMVKGCGHAAHIEDPVACAEKIRELVL